MVLPWDVLLYAMAYMPPDDISRFMRTCHTLYKLGVRELMEEYKVSLVHVAERRRLLSFHRFMFKSPERPSYLRTLDIDSSLGAADYDYSVEEDPAVLPPRVTRMVPTIVKVLQGACNLQTLFLDCHDDFLGSDAGFTSALASFKNLDGIVFYNVGKMGHKALQQMRSPLSCATIEYAMEQEQDTLLLPALSGFKDHLQLILRLDYPPRILADVDLHFLRVDTLDMKIMSWDLSHRDLAYTFPNLAELLIDCIHLVSDAADAERGKNETPANQSWEALDILSCDPEVAYVLAIKCPVRWWKQVCVTLSSTADVRFFQTCINDFRPTRLDICVSASRKHCMLTELFPESTISHLCLTLEIYRSSFSPVEESDIIDPPAVLVRIHIISLLQCC